MSFTLATLKTAIQDYLEVSETTFTNQLNTFIKESEDRIFSFVQLPDQRKNVQGNLTSGNRFLATPTDFYAPMSLAIISSSTYDYLDYKHPSFIKEFSPGTTQGTPKYYANYDDFNIIVAPTPAAADTVQINYIKDAPNFTSTNNTFLSTYQESMLLHGVLAEAFRFLKGPQDMYKLYFDKYNEELQNFALQQMGSAIVTGKQV